MCGTYWLCYWLLPVHAGVRLVIARMAIVGTQMMSFFFVAKVFVILASFTRRVLFDITVCRVRVTRFFFKHFRRTTTDEKPKRNEQVGLNIGPCATFTSTAAANQIGGVLIFSCILLKLRRVYCAIRVYYLMIIEQNHNRTVTFKIYRITKGCKRTTELSEKHQISRTVCKDFPNKKRTRGDR